MRVREFILLIFIILVGISFYFFYSGKVHVDFDDVEGLRFTTRERFTFEETQVIEPPFPGLIKVVNSRGDIEIFGSEDKAITIYFQKEIWRKKEEQAVEDSEKIHLIISQAPERVNIATSPEEPTKHTLKTRFRIYLPSEMSVEVENSYGLVRVSDVREAKIINPFGKVFASGVEGTLSIKNSHKDVEVENIQSNVEIDSKYSVVLVKKIQGDVRINHSYGRVNLENTLSTVSIDGHYSDIACQKLLGSSEIRNSYRKIILNETGPVKITGNHSSVEIEKVKGDVTITNDNGKAKLTDIVGNVSVKGKSLEISGRSIQGDEISLMSSYENISLSESSGKTTIILSHGDLTLAPSSSIHPITVSGDYADIIFYWPQGGQFPFEARVENGEIRWNLAAEISSWEEDHTTVLRAFLVGAEKPLVSLSTTYRNILVEE